MIRRFTKLATNQGQRTTWISAGVIGVLVLALLLWFADPASLLQQLKSANWWLLTLAIMPLCAEVTFTSLRVQHCVNQPISLSLAMYANSLYIAWLSILPARLGELAGIAVFKRNLKMSTGSAIASVIVQRIYDVLVLSGMLVACMSQSLYGGTTGILIAATTWLVLMVMLFTLPIWLTCGAKVLYSRRSVSWLRKVLYVLLQARTWYRHQSAPGAIRWLVASTVGKWSVNLVAVTMIFAAVGVQFGLPLMATIVILMHFLGAVPLQSVGGFGAAEVGLTGILVSLGTPAEQAVAASLLVRVVFLCFSFLFFCFCFVVLRTKVSPGDNASTVIN